MEIIDSLLMMIAIEMEIARCNEANLDKIEKTEAQGKEFTFLKEPLSVYRCIICTIGVQIDR